MGGRIGGILLVLALAWTGCVKPRDSLVVGKVTPPASLPPEAGPPEIDAPEIQPPSTDGLAFADGTGPGAALAWRGAVDVPRDLVFYLVIGSDARPGQDVLRSRADSIHIAAVDPRNGRGTVLGIPRDSWVDVPGHGTRKINSALALGGPQLLARTVRQLTGLPVSYYAVTGFEGFVAIVDELGGLDVHVDRRMRDKSSGTAFEPGWHHLDGRRVLAFTRDRHSSPDGDVDRTRNQGKVILHALAKLRAETSDAAGIRRWLGVLFRHGRLDMSFEDAVRLGSFARTLAPDELVNVVAPGESRRVDGESVVILSRQAYELFADVGADAVADGRRQRIASSPDVTATPATSESQPGGTASPPATRSPAASPTPTPAPSGGGSASPTPTPIVGLR